MISRIRENFAQFVESMNVKKEEILKQNKFISLENLLSFYEENKKILLDKKENLLATLNKYFPNINLNINLKFNLDLSFLEKLEIDNIDEIVEKLEKFYEANYIEPVESNLRKKVVEKFKKIIKFTKNIFIKKDRHISADPEIYQCIFYILFRINSVHIAKCRKSAAKTASDSIELPLAVVLI